MLFVQDNGICEYGQPEKNKAVSILLNVKSKY